MLPTRSAGDAARLPLCGGGRAADLSDRPLRRRRLRSQLIGLGPDPDRPGEFGVGLAAGVPVVRVDALGYELWQWGHLCDSLWHACAVLAEASDDLPDAEAALTRSLAVLQILIAHGAIHLDEAREDRAVTGDPATYGVVRA